MEEDGSTGTAQKAKALTGSNEGILRGMKTFQGVVRAEGSSANLRVTIPFELLPSLTTPGWARLSINGTSFFGFVRRPPSRPTSATATLPKWCLSQLHAGQVITVAIEDAARYRATARSGFDWLAHVADRYFPTAPGDALLLHNQYEPPFEIRRSPDQLVLYRLLGLYQAEGSKSTNAPDFTLANSNVQLLAHAVKLLETWGIDRSRLSLEVLRAPDDKASVIRKLYEPIDVEIVAERVRTGAGGHAGVLHVRNSMPLLRLVRSALDKVFKEEFPSREAAREYALGWLDGDGGVVVGKTSIDLRLAGGASEHSVVKTALTGAFGWVFERGAYHRNTDDGTHVTLRAHEMLDLLDAGAFAFSMNRVRLLLGFDQRTEKLAEVVAGQRATAGPWARWGLITTRGVPTDRGRIVLAGRQRYGGQFVAARQLRETRPELFGAKGVPLPDGFGG